MDNEDGYGEEGYTVIGMDRYTAQEGHPFAWSILSFFLGGLVGAGIALLLTPQSGRKTRQQLKEVSHDARAKAESYYSQAREKMGSAMDRGKEFMGETKPLLTAAIEAGKMAYEKEKANRMDGSRG